ncbi:MAG: polysaccharide deacetylase family protein [Gammaproteobacteria bacterium]|nr:polysaccharide deacetylase family protein [Gammaproteobacteria bacterium]MDH3412365.1 polysaccharide deacetylase family protein [Gammaproteobacteria bacterium]
MNEWDALDAELDRWARAGSVATFWWRDDDAEGPTAALSKLLELSESHAVPLGLAVIPATVSAKLPRQLKQYTMTRVLQHGFAHTNHAPSNEKAAEYGTHRPLSEMTLEIAGGATCLRTLFDERFLPLLVPPWNRVADSLVPMLPSLGLAGLSTFAARPTRSPAPGLKQVNTHVDLIDWRHGRGFRGTAWLVEEITAHLSARRREQADGREPTGILSHHLAHDEGCWRFLDQLFTRTRGRENVQWLTPGEALETGEALDI